MTATASAGRPRPPVVIDDLFDDAGLVDRILERESPHPNTLAGDEFVETRRQLEAAAAQGDGAPAWMQVDDAGRPVMPGIFRTTWADGDILAEETDRIAHHPTLIDAAARLFDAEIVRPYFVYSNISTPMGQSQKHIDITAFRGIDRHNVPTWLINAMHTSGLFRRWHIKIATGVAWFYDGPGGEFTYWPEGADGVEIPFDAARNRCIVGDNDHMPHRVEKVGRGEPRFSLDATISAMDDGWLVDDHGDSTAFAKDEVRVSVSWKAQVFTDAADARFHDEHLDDLDLTAVSNIFAADLEGQGEKVTGTATDPEFGAAIRRRYLAGMV